MLVEVKKSGTGKIREFSRTDIPAVQSLWVKAFQKCSAGLAPLSGLFEETFFLNPWYSADLPSLVHEDSSGDISGFVGVLPRPMFFRDDPIRVAVASQFMVDKSKQSAFASAQMLRRLFSGPQDLTFADGANELAQRVWQAAGGQLAMLYAPVWIRVLRPSEYVLAKCNERNFLPALDPLARPLCWAIDRTAKRWKRGPYWLPPVACDTESPTNEVILCSLRRFAGSPALRPDYNLESLTWLLEKAAEQTKHGQLRKAVIRDDNGEIRGWYLYYVKPRGIGQVLQFGGTASSIPKVLTHLYEDAWREGAIAVSGQLEPKFALELARSHCFFHWSCGVLVHSRNKQILNAIDRGDAFLSRLEGEWWMRFCDFRD
ncbi:MAG: hypothetical protein HYX72_08495 [Acidobacteria bacterium]|nr:hypothetical protein [Acidobacteriota bacterium]